MIGKSSLVVHLLCDRNGLTQPEADFGLRRKRHGFRAGGNDTSGTGSASGSRPDARAFTASSHGADDRPHPGCRRDNTDILVGRTGGLLAKWIGLNPDMLPVGSVELGQLQ